LIFTGGVFHKNTLSFESPEGLEIIRNFRANKAFVTASGIDYRFGATCSNYYERPTKKTLMQSSMKKILLVDSSKFGLIRSDYFADLNEFDEIITDNGIPDEYKKIILSLGITLRIA
jgi:DeoR family deoxyribose operon repressor